MAAQLTNNAGSFADRDRSIRETLARSAAAWRRYRRYRATAAELRALSVREREDIGLAGEDVDAVAWRAVYGL